MARGLLIEIGTEEIPATYLKEAAEGFKNSMLSLFRERNLSHGEVKLYFTPRRIALGVEELEEREPDRKEEVKGPPEKIAYKDGEPTQALLGFCKSQGVSPEEVYVKETEKGRFVFVKKKIEGEPAGEIIRKNLPSILRSIPFPKRMRWETSGFEFARPIRWLVVIFGEEVIPVEVAGVKAGNKSRGHRFLGKEVEVTPENYEKMLEQERVIPDFEKRKKIILEEMKRLAEEEGGRVREDEELLNEVACMVEYPKVIKGRFDGEFLSLPSDVVITAMKAHQRYFAVERNGELLPVFLAVIDTEPSEEIVKGNERVLKARLEDARFYWEEDLRIPLKERIKELSGVVWQEGLGTLEDRVKRLEKISLRLHDILGMGKREVIEEGVMLCKVDLVSSMIRDGKEFTSLEGLIGAEYAKNQGYPPDVARIIYEHYLPRFSGDKLPESPESVVVAIAERLELIAGAFVVDAVPTGSKDPLGIRRAANTLYDILFGKEIHLSLEEIFKFTLSLFGKEELLPSVLSFMQQRLERYLEERGIRYDVVDAVVSVYYDDPVEAKKKVDALREMMGTPDFTELIIGQKRVANILKGVGERGEVKPELFKEEMERVLYERARECEPELLNAVKAHDYKRALEILLSLKPHIDKFFDDVLVMCEDEGLRENRLNLLHYVRSLFLKVGDLSKVVE